MRVFLEGTATASLQCRTSRSKLSRRQVPEYTFLVSEDREFNSKSSFSFSAIKAIIFQAHTMELPGLISCLNCSVKFIYPATHPLAFPRADSVVDRVGNMICTASHRVPHERTCPRTVPCPQPSEMTVSTASNTLSLRARSFRR